jgi:transcriptional regulator with XRE-family HTH domain
MRYAVSMPKNATPEVTISERFGRRVRQLRQEQGLSQVVLCERMGMQQGFLSRLESGLVEPCLGTLEKLSGAFGISLSQFFTGM